jgi:hypothetical protein
MQRAVEELFHRVVLKMDGSVIDRAGIEGLALECGFSRADAAALGEDCSRFLIYRKLVRGTLREALVLAIPRAIARLGPTFDMYFDRFLRERGPESHYLRDVTAEFLDFCDAPFRVDPAVPVYLLDLARHEALRFRIAAAVAAAPPKDAAPLDLSAGVQFTEASAIMRYAHAVHELSEDLGATDVPSTVPSCLFVYRSPDDDVRYLELTPLAASILERLHAGRESLRDAITGACAAHKVVLCDDVLAGTARLLSDLADRGALFGPRSEHASASATHTGDLNAERVVMKLRGSDQ